MARAACASRCCCYCCCCCWVEKRQYLSAHDKTEETREREKERHKQQHTRKKRLVAPPPPERVHAHVHIIIPYPYTRIQIHTYTCRYSSDGRPCMPCFSSGCWSRVHVHVIAQLYFQPKSPDGPLNICIYGPA